MKGRTKRNNVQFLVIIGFVIVCITAVCLASAINSALANTSNNIVRVTDEE